MNLTERIKRLEGRMLPGQDYVQMGKDIASQLEALELDAPLPEGLTFPLWTFAEYKALQAERRLDHESDL